MPPVPSFHPKRGQALMEIIVVTAIFALVAASVIPVWVGSIKTGKQGVEYAVAAGYLAEGVQAVRAIRDRDWGELESGAHGLSIAGGTYALSGSSEELADGFTRFLLVEDAFRQGGLTGDLDPAGDTPDPNTKRITVNVQWSVVDGNPQNLDTVVYLPNWEEPSWVQTTIADFTAGSENSTDVQAAGNGAVSLRASASAWDTLETLYAVDLPGTGERIGMQFDRDRDVLYILSTNTDGDEFLVLDTSAVSEASPVILDGLEAPDINGFVAHNGFIYLAGTNNAAEISVYDARTLALVRTVDMAGNADAMGVGAYGNMLAVARDQADDAVAFYNIVNPASGMPLLGQTDLDEHVEKVALTQTHAFVGGRDNEEEIFVIRLSDLSEVASVDLEGNNDVQMLLAQGNTLYVSRTNGTAWDFGALDMTDPTSPTLIGTHELGVDAGGFAISPSGDYAFVGTSADGSELVAIELDTFGQVAEADVAGNEDGRSSEIYGAHAYLGSTSNTQDLSVFRTAQGDWDVPISVANINKVSTHDVWETAVQGSTLFVATQHHFYEEELFIYDITNPAAPLWLASYEVGTHVRDMDVQGDSVYLATDSDSQEIMILDVSVITSPTLIGSFDANSGSTEGKSVLVDGDIVYLGRNFGDGDEFFVVDVSDPALPLALGHLPFSANINDLAKAGNYVFAATGADAAELIVIDVSDPLLPAIVFQYDVPDTVDATDNALLGDLLLLGTQTRSGAEFLLFDVSNPTAPSLVGQSEINGHVWNIAFDGATAAFLATGVSGAQLQRWDLSVPSLPRLQSSHDQGAVANAVAADGVHAFTGTNHDTKDIQIIGPSPDVTGFAREGTFTSQAFDSVSAATVWDRIEWTGSGSGTLQVRIRTADTLTNLDTARWVGEDGTVESFYAVSGDTLVLDPSASGSRFIQWKAYLTGDGITSPILEDVTLYY